MAAEKGKGALAAAAEKRKGVRPAAAEKGKEALAAAAEKRKGGRPAAAAEKGKGGRPTADADDDRTVRLKSSDEQIFEVPAKLAKLFKAIDDVVDKGYADDTIPLPNVDSSTLADVVEFCENHLRTNAQPDGDARSWDKEFVSELDVDALFHVLMAAHYLDYERLVDLTCEAVADWVKGKTVEQICAAFGIENDFTPEEEAALHAENAWAFED